MASSAAPSSVSVAVISFNTREKLRECLSRIEPQHEVIVVDNNSHDGSAEMVASNFPNAVLIRNAENRGFGPANNQAISAATHPLVLLLNSDAYADPGAIGALAAVLEDPAVVAVGGRLLNPDGTLQLSSAEELTLWAVFCEQTYLERLFPRSRFFNHYWNTWRLSDREPCETPQVMGACLMMRPVEKFDERFFLYCEDTELCRRLIKHGKILYVPGAIFIHDLGSSSSQGRWKSVARYNHGKELYFSLHHGAGACFTCLLLDRFGALLRLIVWTLMTMATFGRLVNSERVRLFARVLLAPIKGPPRG